MHIDWGKSTNYGQTKKLSPLTVYSKLKSESHKFYQITGTNLYCRVGLVIIRNTNPVISHNMF